MKFTNLTKKHRNIFNELISIQGIDKNMLNLYGKAIVILEKTYNLRNRKLLSQFPYFEGICDNIKANAQNVIEARNLNDVNTLRGRIRQFHSACRISKRKINVWYKKIINKDY